MCKLPDKLENLSSTILMLTLLPCCCSNVFSGQSWLNTSQVVFQNLNWWMMLIYASYERNAAHACWRSSDNLINLYVTYEHENWYSSDTLLSRTGFCLLGLFGVRQHRVSVEGLSCSRKGAVAAGKLNSVSDVFYQAWNKNQHLTAGST